MPGHAFSIEDALLAARWAEQIASHGYRVVISPSYENAEEIIEVYIPHATAPAFRVRRTIHAVVVTDCVGLTLAFPALVDALLAMVPLSKPGRRAMLKGGSPTWLPTVFANPASPAGSIRSRVGKLASCIMPASAKWHRAPDHQLIGLQSLRRR